MPDGIPTDPPVSREIDFGALVKEALGDEYHKHEKVYQFQGGRKFESSDYGTQGFYRAKSVIDFSGTAQGGDSQSITLGTDANGGANDYVGHRITTTDFATNTHTGVIVGYIEATRLARVIPKWSSNFVLHTGTAQAGASTSLTLGTSAPTVLSGTLSLTSGAGSTQSRDIFAYDGSTKVATVSPNWNAQYLDLPGTAGNYASTPDSAAVSITGNIDIRVKMAMDDWTPDSIQFVAGRAAPLQRSCFLQIATSGTVNFIFSTTGGNEVSATSTATTGFTDGTAHWLRATFNSTSGDVTFYTSEDGASWSQLGNVVSTVGGMVHDSTADFTIGQSGFTSQFFAGKIYYAEVRNGIDGPVVAKFDPLDDGGKIGDTSFISSTGEVWTINQSGSPAAELDGPPDATTGYEVESATPAIPVTYSISSTVE